MKCHAGVEYPSGKPCPKCGAKLGEVCWPGINADLADVKFLRAANEKMKAALKDAIDVFEGMHADEIDLELLPRLKLALT